MNIIYFTMKKLNENRAFLAMLGFLFVFSCKDSGNGNGDGKEDPAPTVIKYTLTITKPTGGKLVSKPGNIDCGGEGTVCKAEFNKGTEVTLTATADKGYAPAAWQGACDKTKAGESTCKLSMDANKTAGRAFGIDTDEDGIPNETDPDDDGDGTDDVTDVDDDNDGLIEVHNLDMFDHIQYNLAGTSYKTGASIADNRTGGPTEATADCTTVATGVYLCGYELTKDLDFAEGASYAGSSVNAAWRPNAQADAGGSAATPDAALNAGFVGADNFAGLFDGNGYKISNLYSRQTATSSASIGLFAGTTATASIRSLVVADAHLYGNSAIDYIGSLIGTNNGTIIASSATGGNLNGGAGNDYIGGLVGQCSGSSGSIIASSATGATINGGAGADHIGGLMGATDYDCGIVIASYAIGGTFNGDAGDDSVGGLIGQNQISTVASYAMGGTFNGGAGDDDVGGLVGTNTAIGGAGSVTASYATGASDGGGGDDGVGSLLGQNLFLDFHLALRGTVTASYAFVSKSGGETIADVEPHDGTAKPDGVTSANGLTATNVDAKWNDAAEKTLNAWDFGTASQPPALRYADYDGDGADFSCDMFPKKIPGTNIPLICGKSLLPGQGR